MTVSIYLNWVNWLTNPQSQCSKPKGEPGRLGISISLCNGICEILVVNLVHVASYPDWGFAWFSSVISFIVGLVFLKSFIANHSLSSQLVVFNVCSETSSWNSLRSIKTEPWYFQAMVLGGGVRCLWSQSRLCDVMQILWMTADKLVDPSSKMLPAI